MKKEMKKEMKEAKEAKEAQDLLDSHFAMVALDQIESVFCSRDMEPRYGAHFLESYIMIRDK